MNPKLKDVFKQCNQLSTNEFESWWERWYDSDELREVLEAHMKNMGWYNQNKNIIVGNSIKANGSIHIGDGNK